MSAQHPESQDADASYDAPWECIAAPDHAPSLGYVHPEFRVAVTPGADRVQLHWRASWLLPHGRFVALTFRLDPTAAFGVFLDSPTYDLFEGCGLVDSPEQPRGGAFLCMWDVPMAADRGTENLLGAWALAALGFWMGGGLPPFQPFGFHPAIPPVVIPESWMIAPSVASDDSDTTI